MGVSVVGIGVMVGGTIVLVGDFGAIVGHGVGVGLCTILDRGRIPASASKIKAIAPLPMAASSQLALTCVNRSVDEIGRGSPVAVTSDAAALSLAVASGDVIACRKAITISSTC